MSSTGTSSDTTTASTTGTSSATGMTNASAGSGSTAGWMVGGWSAATACVNEAAKMARQRVQQTASAIDRCPNICNRIEKWRCT